MGEREEFVGLLKKLSEAFGISGYEDEVRNIVLEFLEPISDEVHVDPLGNVYALKRGSGEGLKVMLDSHMDEIGFLVRHIEDDGFLRILPVGGWVDYVLPAQRVRVWTPHGLIRGVVGVLPPHLIQSQEDRRKSPPIEDMWVDIGVSSREEAERLGVRIGSPVDIERDFTVLADGDRVTGKSLDDRAGVAIALWAFKSLKEPEADVYLTVTVQEEVGLKGAHAASYRVKPDLAIEVDVTSAADLPGIPSYKRISRVGGGPIVKVADGRAGRGLLAHPEMLRLLEDTAKEEGIPLQRIVSPSGSTNASVISISNGGVPSVVVAVPTRYLHSPVELLSITDALNAARLISSTIMRVSKKWYGERLAPKKIK